MTTYSRYAACTKGHRIEVTFTWDSDITTSPTDYSEPCPAEACVGRVNGKLPIGALASTIRLTVAR